MYSINTLQQLYFSVFVNFVLRSFVIILDDYCRVVLSGGENDDYINATYIDVSFSLFSHEISFIIAF